MTRSRRRAASAVMWGWCSQRMWRTAFPTFLLAGHRKSACSRFSTGCAWQPRDLQFGLAAEFVLCSLSLVTSSLCTSLKRKDVCSGPRPFNPVSLHEFFQSVSGLLPYILVGIKCPCLSPIDSMVQKSSKYRRYHCFSVIVVMFKGVSRWTWRIFLKNCAE